MLAYHKMGCNKTARENTKQHKSTKRSMSQQSLVGGFTSKTARSQHLQKRRLNSILYSPFLQLPDVSIFGFLTRICD